MASPAPYHHGDLRSTLLEKALALVAADGAAALSLRALAREAGVSPMAPYHHFADRAALVAAVAEIGFGRLYAVKLAALDGAGADPVDMLVAGARAYVAFILDHPELYRLMKGPELADRSAHPGLAAAAALPSAKLAELIAGMGPLSVSAPVAAQSLWAFVHGLGMLALDGYGGGRDSTLQLAADGTAAMLAGFAA